MKNTRPPGWLLAIAFTAIYFVWGTTYLANLFALKSLPPFIISCFRYLGAGIVLAIWIKFKRLPLPNRRTIKVLCISGILMLVGGSGIIVFAEQYIKSGYAAALVATEPLWFVLFDRKRWRLYFSNWLVLSGLILGFAGITLFAVFAPAGSAADGNLVHLIMGTLMVSGSAILWVCGTLYADAHVPAGNSNITNTGIQLLAAGIFSGVIALARGEWSGFALGSVRMEAWAGWLYLVVMGSLVAYLAFTWLVTVQPPAIVSTHTFVNPVVAIVMGWLVADEHVTVKQIVALTIAFSGVVLAQIGKRRFSEEN
jgi:drug/metabolite transporter (DMT)-like permease